MNDGNIEAAAERERNPLRMYFFAGPAETAPVFWFDPERMTPELADKAIEELAKYL